MKVTRDMLRNLLVPVLPDQCTDEVVIDQLLWFLGASNEDDHAVIVRAGDIGTAIDVAKKLGLTPQAICNRMVRSPDKWPAPVTVIDAGQIFDLSEWSQNDGTRTLGGT